MFRKIIKFLNNEPKFKDDSKYSDFDEPLVNSYREEYADVAMDEIRIPDIEFEEIRIQGWFKNDGEEITKGETICQLVADGRRIDLESNLDGYIYFRQPPNTHLYTGDFVCLILSKKI